MEIHKLVKKIREEKNFSQEYIANQLSLSQSQYCRREKGSVKFLADEIFKLSQIFEIPVSSLFIFNGDVSLVNNNNGILSKKLIAQYEIRLQEKDELIKLLSGGDKS